MGTLAAALDWAARGFPVFPVKENSREPAFASDWNDIATVDPQAIRNLWVDPVLGTERNYNIGCMCSDYVVVDIDVKKGKNGYHEYMGMGGNFDTLVVRTPSGGYHCYFLGPDSNNAPLSNGVDVRSHRGYVVAPGSSIDGAFYEVVHDIPLAWIPLAIEHRLVSPYARNEAASATLDTAAAIDAAIRFLQSAPLAVEGQRGDELTFITAARMVREMALSVNTAHQLMLQYWNPRCTPPWDAEELLRKVENASNYGSADTGRLSPETLFGHLTFTAPPTMFAQVGDWGNGLDAEHIPARPWLVHRMLMLRAVTVLLASGAAGKSTWSLIVAAHLAYGRDIGTFEAKMGPQRSIVYNGEDDVDEQSRRLSAICIAYGLDYNYVKSRLILMSAREFKLQLVTREGGRAVRNDAIINQLIEKASAADIGMVSIDPLVKVHQCDENDNVGMDVVMEVLTDIAHHANVAVLALHHTAKASSMHQEQRIGNPDIARGASSVVNAARIAFTLVNASNQDAEDYGFPSAERHMYVRLDDAKMNMTLAGDKAAWYKRDGVQIFPSRDVVGVLRMEKLEKSKMHIRTRLAEILIAALELGGRGSMAMSDAISVIKAEEPLWANKKDPEIRKGLQGFFVNGIEIAGKKLSVKRDDKDGAGTNLLVTLE